MQGGGSGVRNDHASRDACLPNGYGSKIECGCADFHPADDTVAAVSNVHVSAIVEDHRGGACKLHDGCQAPIAGVSVVAVTSNRTDRSGCVHLADRIVRRIGNIKIAAGIGSDVGGTIEFRAGGGTAIARVAKLLVAGNRRDDSIGRDFADVTVRHFREIDVALAIHSETGDASGLSEKGLAAVSAEARSAIAGELGYVADGVDLPYALKGTREVDIAGCVGSDTADQKTGGSCIRRNVPVDRYFAHAGVEEVGDVEIAGAVECDGRGESELCLGGGTAITAVALDSVARNGRDGASDAEFPDDTVGGVGHIEIALAVDGHAGGKVQLRCARRTAITGIATYASSGHRAADPGSEGKNRGRTRGRGDRQGLSSRNPASDTGGHRRGSNHAHHQDGQNCDSNTLAKKLRCLAHGPGLLIVPLRRMFPRWLRCVSSRSIWRCDRRPSPKPVGHPDAASDSCSRGEQKSSREL